MLKSRIEGTELPRVFLEGVITETSNIEEVFAPLQGDIILDLHGIESINSIGIHRWVPHISKYSKEHQVKIFRVSYPLIIQRMCISNIFGTAEIASCDAPYFCPHCSQEYLIEVTQEDYKKSNSSPPKKTCSSCSTALSFDELPDYFVCIWGAQK